MLTKTQIDRLKWNPKGPATQITYDAGGKGAVSGFGVRVHPTGRKAFIVWYRTKTGRLRMMTLGQYGPLTVQQARDKARKAVAAARDGNDPMDTRRNEREAATVRSFAPIYMEQHAKRRKKTWREDQRRIDTYILPKIGHRKLSDVRRADVKRLHNDIGTEKPFEANRVLALVAVLFTKAVELGYLPEGAPNPAKGIESFDEQSRDRYVTPTELPALMMAIGAEDNPYIRAAFRMYLLTGLRRSELLSLRWKDVDLNARTLRLEMTKSGRPHVLPLSEPACAILRDLPRMLHNPYVFAGHIRGRPLVNVAKPWRRIRARVWMATNPDAAKKLHARVMAGAKRRNKHASNRDAVIAARVLALAEKKAMEDGNLRLHDLRRTVGSWLAMGGASLPLIGKVLNHSNASTTQVYARLAEDAPRAALEELAQRMAAIASAEQVS